MGCWLGEGSETPVVLGGIPTGEEGWDGTAGDWREGALGIVEIAGARVCGSGDPHIRVHTDTTAAQSAKALKARAYAAGNSIVFAEGQFAPHSAGGQKLLAHELAHTVQQGSQPQLIQRSPGKDDDSGPPKPRDVIVTQKMEGNKVTYREQLNRGREHALLVRVMDLGTFPPRAEEWLYRGQELPSMRGNKTEISWVDVTSEARRNGLLAVDWNMPDVDADDPKKQQEKDREIANQHPNPVLSLLVPVSNSYVKDRSAEIHDPLIRSQYQVDRQGIEAGTNLGRVTAAVVADTVAALSFAPAVAEAASALAPEGLYAARAAYLNAPAIYANTVLYGGAAMTGVALAAHIQKIRSKGFDPSDIPQLAEDLMPAVGGYLEAQSFNTSAPNGKPSGAATRDSGAQGEPAEPDMVIPRPAQFDSRTGKISGTVIRPGTGETFDAEMDPATGNGQIVDRGTRRVVGIIRNGEIEKRSEALPAAQPAAAGRAASSATPRTAHPPAKPTTQREMDEIADQQKQTISARNDKGPPKGKTPGSSEDSAAKGGRPPVGGPAAENEDGDQVAGNPNQRRLNKQEKTITSDVDSRSAKVARRDSTQPKTVYEIKKMSKDPSDQAEVRVAERFAEDGHDVHFNDDDRHGDLKVDGVATDVKHLEKTNSIVSAVQRGLKQGEQVILDGTTVKLTPEDTYAEIRELEAEIAKHPGKFRNLKTIFIVEGDGTIYIYHTGKSDVAPLKVKPQ